MLLLRHLSFDFLLNLFICRDCLKRRGIQLFHSKPVNGKARALTAERQKEKRVGSTIKFYLRSTWESCGTWLSCGSQG